MIIKYLNYKIKLFTKELESDKFFELKDLENFLNLFMELSDHFDEFETMFLYNNRDLFRRVVLKYNVLSKDETELFISFLRELVNKSPSFTSSNYKFIMNVLDKVKKSEYDLYENYEKLSNELTLFEKQNEDMKLLKVWFEDIKSDVENKKVITDESFIDFICDDKLVDKTFKIKLISEIEKYNKACFKSYVPLSLEKVKEILSRYGYDVKDNNYLTIISANYTLVALTEILNTIRQLKLNFNNDVLAKILINGTSKNTIKNAYDKIINDNKYNLNATLKIYNFWIDKIVPINHRNKISSSLIPKDSSPSSINNDYDDNYELNSDEMFRTSEYLKKYDFYNSTFDGMKSILKIPVEKLMKRENVLNLYGISVKDIKGSMTLFSPNIITMLDQFIELDLKDYILEHLSTLSSLKSLPVVIFKKKNEGKEYITSKGLDPSVKEEIGEYKAIVKSVGLQDARVENRKEYDDIVSVNGSDKIVPMIYQVPIIKHLEENYRINELQYKIGRFVFSRKKVLRIASSLVLNNEITYDEFLYIMTYKTLLNEYDVDEIEDTLKHVYTAFKNYVN